MNILVCGGAGYIGSHMVRVLVRAGHKPVVFDNFSTGHHWAVESAFKGSSAGPAVIMGDILDKAALESVFKQYPFDAVMHFAALAQVGESVSDPGRYYENNVSGTLNILQAMTRAGVDKLIFSSTCATYGVPEKMPIVEYFPLNPVNPYGRSKRMAEMMMSDFATAHGLKSAALRYFNAAGADIDGDLGEDHTPETHLIPNAITAVLGQNVDFKIFGDDYPTPDGTCVRDYIHVQDLAQAHLLALDYLGQQNAGVFEFFNLGTGQGTSNLEIIRSVERVSGRQLNFSFAPRRPGDPPSLYANAHKADQVLGWSPKFTKLDDIVASAWRWHEAE